MKKVKATPIQDKINRSIIKGLFIVMNDCMNTIREAEKEKIIETNNNYYVYKMNYDYIKNAVKFLSGDYIYSLFSEEDKKQLNTILRELNMLSVTFNENIKQFNDSEKRKKLIERAHLKPIKAITINSFTKEK